MTYTEIEICIFALNSEESSFLALLMTIYSIWMFYQKS